MKKHMAPGILLSALAVYLAFESASLYSRITGPDGAFLTDADSGIGLYLCRRILRALNHDIEINSAPGAGTVVRIRLQTRQGRLE